MKKVMTTVAIAALFLTTGNIQAQSSQSLNSLAENASHIAGLDNTFKEIKTKDVPSAVKKAIKRDFDSAEVGKAYINDDKEYKLMLKMEEATQMITVYADEKGNWIKPTK